MQLSSILQTSSQNPTHRLPCRTEKREREGNILILPSCSRKIPVKMTGTDFMFVV